MKSARVLSCLFVILWIAAEARAQGPNLALGKTVMRSSACSCGLAESAVDGSVDTFWQPLSADRSDLNVWLTVDLGAPATIDRAVLNFRTKTALVAFFVRASNDNSSWQEVYRSSGTIDTIHTAAFSAPVTARYVRVDFTLSDGAVNFQVNELELYRSGTEPEPEPPTNLALNKATSHSSDCSCGRSTAAVDGNVATFWQPLSGDRADLNVWLRVDLGAPLSLDRFVLNFRTKAGLVAFVVRTSNDDASWQEAYQSSGTIDAVHADFFPATILARFVRVDFTLNSGTPNFQLNEFELYDTGGVRPPPVLVSASLADASGRTYATGETVSLRIGDQLPLRVVGMLSNGQEADMQGATVTFVSSKPAAASVDPNGMVIAASAGVARITASATLDGVTKETHIWVDVSDPTLLLADVRLTHPRMRIEVGWPAVLAPGDEYPVLHVTALVALTLTADLISPGHNAAVTIARVNLAPGTQHQIRLTGAADTKGLHQIRLRLKERGRPPAYDAFLFTVMDPADVPQDQSAIAYVGAGGALVYVPDYKGNRIVDFSNSGYMGGGVRLPDVQARIAVEPGEGDDSERIQAAIDQVSQMPPNAEGIRGAVLLKRGRFEVGTTLFIRASGVVIRGEGREETGTVLHATGATRRDVLVVRGGAGRSLLATRTAVADLYLPSGARTFHVEDASGFRVGDAVVVRRNGNDRWIHHLAMDQILERPGEEIDETTQWSPFSLDFDRVITQIDDDIITVDAPVPNAIERVWGGGELIKYDHPDRIEHVGIENLRVDVEFNSNVTLVRNGVPYFADENHAVRFVTLDNVKNAWVREVTSLHLEHSLANVLRQAKWVTVQDSAAIEMVSRIDGGRRYNFALAGQLTLVQRAHAEEARHAFVVDSRVPGPNVFLDNDSVNEYATSEPHHRWSVGGLYDNVKADIAIQDRAWLGTGHGWAGANYVTWNTEGDLVVQQPPTAQNYAIGHVGPKRSPFVPNSEDPRPRADGYWEHLGQHVLPRSLYLQQLEERLGAEAVGNIARTAVGGGALDVAAAGQSLPLLNDIHIGGTSFAAFSPTVFDYVVALPGGTTEAPGIVARSSAHFVEYLPAPHPNGRAVLIVRDRRDPDKSVRYTIRFVTPQ
jgi:hypothetical protein